MNLNECRGRIDEIDDEILRLFIERMGVSAEVARYKAEHNIATLNRSREREILLRIAKSSGEELGGYSKILFTTLFDLSRSYQKHLTTGKNGLTVEIDQALEKTPPRFPGRGVVACQGIEGAYSQIACDKLFSLADIVYVRNFSGVFQAVAQGLCEYGILPIDNSSAGTVDEVYDLMRNNKFYIVRGLKLQICHTLLVPSGVEKSGIREIFSHEQALKQCSKFISGLENVKITICDNTATAAKMVSESGRRDVGAIASRECAELYGLKILENDIQNSDYNYTRFICISKKLQIFPGANKISLMLTLPHRPGSLYGMISKFSALGVNLTKLESRPIPGRDFEFMFYFDLEASLQSPEIIRLLGELSGSSDIFVFLGAYSEL